MWTRLADSRQDELTALLDSRQVGPDMAGQLDLPDAPLAEAAALRAFVARRDT